MDVKPPESAPCCRLCTKEEPKMQELTPNLMFKIRKVLPIVILSGDLLPHQICLFCLQKLNDFSAFYDQVKISDLYFRKPFVQQQQDPLDVADPFITYHDIHLQMTAAYKAYMNIDQTDLDEDFIRKNVDNTLILVCKSCKRTYLSESSAIMHECKAGTMPNGDGEQMISDATCHGEAVFSCPEDIIEMTDPPSRKRKFEDMNGEEIVCVDIEKVKKKKKKKVEPEEIEIVDCCIVCERIFLDKDELSSHMESHTGSSADEGKTEEATSARTIPECQVVCEFTGNVALTERVPIRSENDALI